MGRPKQEIKKEVVSVYLDPRKPSQASMLRLVKSGNFLRIGNDTDEACGYEIILRLALHAFRQLGFEDAPASDGIVRVGATSARSEMMSGVAASNVQAAATASAIGISAGVAAGLSLSSTTNNVSTPNSATSGAVSPNPLSLQSISQTSLSSAASSPSASSPASTARPNPAQGIFFGRPPVRNEGDEDRRLAKMHGGFGPV